MKIQAPNYTQSPNVFYDEIFKTLKEGELRVILVVIRQTFGWHKSFDRISLGQLADKTGMERKSVCRSLNSLMEKGLIQKRKFGDAGKEVCYYSLITEEVEKEDVPGDDGLESEEEELLTSNNSYQCPKDTRPVSLGHQTSVLKTPTKETLTKENIQKKQQQAASPPSAAVFSCLKEISLDESAIKKLMEFSEDRVELAVKFMKSQKIPPDKPAGMLIWHCNQQTPPPAAESKDEVVEKNRTWAKKREEEWLRNRTGCRIDALKDCCQVVIGGQKGTIDFSYEDAKMIDKLKEELKKRE